MISRRKVDFDRRRKGEMEQDKRPPDEDAKRQQVDDLGSSTRPKQRRDGIKEDSLLLTGRFVMVVAAASVQA